MCISKETIQRIRQFSRCGQTALSSAHANNLQLLVKKVGNNKTLPTRLPLENGMRVSAGSWNCLKASPYTIPISDVLVSVLGNEVSQAQAVDPDQLDREVRRCVGVVVAIEDVGGLVEVQAGLGGEAA